MSAVHPSTKPRRELRHAVDSSRPHAFLIETERAESDEIVSVAIVFLKNRECPWRCVYCDLWKSALTETVPLGAIPAQIDYALARLWGDEFHESPSDQSGTRGTRPSNVRQIKLYNAGSFFDAKAIPPEDFAPIAERVCQFERVIVECHPALVGQSAVRFRDLLSSHSSIASTLEVAMGLEIADDSILGKLNKQMTLEMFARAAKFLREHEIAVRAFVMVKPPFVNSEAQALQFALHSIDFAFDCGATVVSLIPARFGTMELEALAQRGDFAPPQLETLETALDYGVALRRGRVFADLWDLEKFSDCTSCFAERREWLSKVNLQQIVVPRIECPACGATPRETTRTISER